MPGADTTREVPSPRLLRTPSEIDLSRARSGVRAQRGGVVGGRNLWLVCAS